MITKIYFQKDVNNHLEVVMHIAGPLHPMFSKTSKEIEGTFDATFYQEGLASFGLTANNGKWWSSRPECINDVLGLKGKYALAKHTVCVYVPEYTCAFGGYAITLDYLEALIQVHEEEIKALGVDPWEYLASEGRTYYWPSEELSLKGFSVTKGWAKVDGIKYIKCWSPNHTLCMVSCHALGEYCLDKYGKWQHSMYIGKTLK